MKNLFHHTERPMVFDRMRVYDQAQPGPWGWYSKPRGLWVSDEDEYGWSTWCRDEEFRLHGLTHPQRVILKPDANLLVLREHHELLAFQEVYGNPDPGLATLGYARYAINWAAVAEDFDGIFITPYQWSARFDVDWYYTWDCASGCIWNLRCIQDIWSPVMEHVMKMIEAKVILAEKRLDRLVDYFERRESQTFRQPAGLSEGNNHAGS